MGGIRLNRRATCGLALYTLVNKEEESLLRHYSSHPNTEILARGNCWYDWQGRHNGNLKQHTCCTEAVQRRRERFLYKLLNDRKKPFDTFICNEKVGLQRKMLA